MTVVHRTCRRGSGGSVQVLQHHKRQRSHATFRDVSASFIGNLDELEVNAQHKVFASRECLRTRTLFLCDFLDFARWL